MISIIIANTFLKLSLEQNVPVTYPELQTLVFNANYDFYSITGRKLIKEYPVGKSNSVIFPSIDYKFNNHSHRPVTKFARDAKGNVRTISLNSKDIYATIIKSCWLDFIRERKG
jgi:uncharacterized phage-associated protein